MQSLNLDSEFEFEGVTDFGLGAKLDEILTGLQEISQLRIERWQIVEPSPKSSISDWRPEIERDIESKEIEMER